MAELALAAPSPIVDAVVKKLASGLWKELQLERSVHTDIEKLKSKLSTIQDVLDDAEKKSIFSKALQGWLRKLVELALDAEDVVEEFETEALRRRIERYDRMTVKVRDFFSSNNPIAFRSKMARKINDVIKRFDEIAKQNTDFNLMVKSDSDRPVDRETKSLVVESEIVGRDDEQKQVMEFLVDKDNEKNISILPIIGLGGIGKTTLAQMVHHNDKIKEQFELRMWVCVGEKFDEKVVLQKMVEQVREEQGNLSIPETMSSFLQEKFRTNRFLLVLDDLWNEDELEWEKLKPLFMHAKSGSKIIVTTRSERVASITGTISPCKLQGLGIDDCWALFKRKAYGLGRLEETPMLVDIGKEIVKKCGGSPLAAKILGSLMGSTGGEEEACLAIRDSEIWRLSMDEVGIVPILKLSYDHLPSHLKRCFTYCSMFPKGHIFEIKRLIRLWMAEGLIDTSGISRNAEDIGKQYLNNLLWTSFFQDVQMDKYNNPMTCTVHDLVHDLACSLTRDEYLVMKMGSKNIPHGSRYISVVRDSKSSIILKTIYEAKKLRSFVLLGQTYLHRTIRIDKFFFNATKNFTQLRALDLSRSRIQKLSGRISRLKHLRFFDISYTEITTLPTSITELFNLQTLNLERCFGLKKLPEGISKLSNLRHIDVSYCYSLSCMPRGLGRLSNLQTLPKFIVARENGLTIAELQHLNHIHGELHIKNLHNVKDANEAMPANLVAKTRLNYLKLEWNKGWDEAQEPSSMEAVGDIFERLRPHHNLRELEIKGYMSIKLPNWMASAELVSSSFPNLVKLTLCWLMRCEHFPPLGQLPSLKHLSVCGMHAVKRIREEFCGDGSAFPSLEELYFYDMPNLEEWHIAPATAGRKIATFPCLTKLSIKLCPKLAVLPCFSCSVEELTIESCSEMLLSARSLARFLKLKKLNIMSCGVSSSSSSGWWDVLQYLTTLEELQIGQFDELTCLPESIMYLPSLHTLYLMDNKNLRSLEREGRKQQPSPFTALQQLSISRCPSLTTLPDCLEHLQGRSSCILPPASKVLQEGDRQGLAQDCSHPTNPHFAKRRG